MPWFPILWFVYWLLAIRFLGSLVTCGWYVAGYMRMYVRRELITPDIPLFARPRALSALGLAGPLLECIGVWGMYFVPGRLVEECMSG